MATSLRDHHVEQSSSVPTSSLAGAFDVSSVSVSSSSPLSTELQYDAQTSWCMQFLTVSHVPVLVESFDEDASGWVKIKEINDFTAGIPDGWKLIEYLAYRSAGRELETVIYSRRTLALFNELVTISTRVLPENIQAHNAYINHWSFARIFELVSIPARWHWKVAQTEGLSKLVSSRMDASIAKWESLLQKGKYEIDSVDAITHISGGRSIEWIFYPIVYVLLRHHVRIARLAVKIVLDEREMLVAENSLAYVVSAAWEKKRILENLFRQQRHEFFTRLKSYAGGFFNNLEAPDTTYSDPVIDPIPSYPEYEAEIERLHVLDNLPLDKLKYSTGRLDDSGYQKYWEEPTLSIFKRKEVPIQYTGRRKIRALWRLATDAIRARVRSILRRRTWAFIKARRDLRLEFLELDYKWKKHNINLKHRGSFHGGIGGALTETQDRRLVEIERSLSHRDYDFYWSMTNVMLSRQFRHTGVRCSGCWTTPYGTRYTCVQCIGFDYCEHCYADPTKNLKSHAIHRFDHDMIKIPRPLPRGLVGLYKKRAHNELKHRADRASDEEKTMRKRKRKMELMHHIDLALSRQDEDDTDDTSEDDNEDEEKGEDEEKSGYEDEDEDEKKSKHGDEFEDKGETDYDSAEEDYTTTSECGTDDPIFLADMKRVSTPSAMTPRDGTTKPHEAPNVTDASQSSSWLHMPVRQQTFTCNGDCGRSDLVLHYLCLDCKNDHVLCLECDDLLTRSAHNHSMNGGRGLSFFLQRQDHSDDVQHSPWHVIFMIKDLDRKIGETEGKKDIDTNDLISQLRTDFTNFITKNASVEQRIASIEGILVGIANRLKALG